MCFETHGCSEFHEEHHVKTRKLHKCIGCNKLYPAKTQMLCVNGKFDGNFYSYYVCQSCERLRLSIAVEEITHGCGWNEAWCPYEELQSYIENRVEPVKVLGLRTVKDCWLYVNQLCERTFRTILLEDYNHATT